jgi:glycerol uptake operon antiterminator
MRVQSSSLQIHPSLRYKVIPVLESQVHLAHILESSAVNTVLLRHCNLFEFSALLDHARRLGMTVYVNIDQIDGIHADAAGLAYLAEHFHVSGVVSNHPRVLAQAKQAGLRTIQRIFAVDSTGLEMSLESVEPDVVDLLDISPALVVPHLAAPLSLPFIASGLIYTLEQIQAVLDAGAKGVAVSLPELWP